MAMAVTYTTFCGRIVSENRGGVKRDYMSDTLGSTVALLDNTQTKTDTWTYWPYGEVASRTGTNPTPFTFVGTLGYFKDQLKRLYVRARHLRVDLGQWTTVDPLWPGQPGFAYVLASPVALGDPTGLIALPPQLIAALIAAITGCLVSAMGSVIGGWFSGDSPPVSICKAATKCLTAAIRGALAVLFGGLAGCIAGLIGSVVNAVADALCPCIGRPCCESSFDVCDGIKTLADGATSCLGGFADQEFRESFGDWLGSALNSFINTVTRGAVKTACKGAADLVAN